MRGRATLLAVLAVGAAVGAAWGAARVKRFWAEDAAFCAQCHRASPELAAWRDSGHRGVACQRCHHAGLEESLAMLRAFVAGRSPDRGRGRGRVEVGACAGCHLAHDDRWPLVAGAGGHRLHAVERRIGCLACHAAGHGLRVADAACQACHARHPARAAGEAALPCAACHAFRGAVAVRHP